ncbi:MULTISPECIES: HDOD domain-containing protein [Rubrivivax]|uniref:HDOD domain-containing protein n=1 Tax=Rubrivivax benzoatilyticus TaxID=316997 RepID=A0ABX0HWD7_9BURK|nr:MULTISPECIES: HDOD domain-containing protein [Rubrivivax]MCD0420582.1 HDOD domain-containing protein [Rubrivivax sp. JA1024]MCC9595734.1 HDOD domain-containing protein [Rubrivivax sp. JA1055]MCC9646759.1 HDOD domain-containing protein [Rubrivivax sp. JA1029]NHK97689.1 HDOD domain-containing protein [Rubrivivax benzoatilyticus]NHL23191.1 HDOD domain-containing protein [Rubrivivax benzoatilyticus]
MTTPPAARPLTYATPAHDVAGWARRFDPMAMPILADTAATLQSLRENEDEVDAHLLTETVAADPLLTLKLLSHVASLQRRSHFDTRGDIETVTAALVMVGIAPFFRLFADSSVVEDWLGDQPEALEGFRKVLIRAHRAANFATAFAVHRMDHDVAVIREAALLHDFTELLLWLHAPTLALEIARLQAEDPALRSVVAQERVLNIHLPDLQQALMTQWRLPPLLVKITNARQSESVQVRNVLLAIRLARHTSSGWDNPAIPDDIVEIASLLNMRIEPTWALLRDIDE